MTTGEGTEGGEEEKKVLRFHGPTGQPKVGQRVLADLFICFFSESNQCLFDDIILISFLLHQVIKTFSTEFHIVALKPVLGIHASLYALLL